MGAHHARVGSHSPRSAPGRPLPHRFYQAQDRWFFLAAAEDEAPLLRQVEGLHLDGINPNDRCQIEPTLEEDFAQNVAADWVQRLRGVTIAAQEKVTVAELIADPEVPRPVPFHHSRCGRCGRSHHAWTVGPPLGHAPAAL